MIVGLDFDALTTESLHGVFTRLFVEHAKGLWRGVADYDADFGYEVKV